MTDPIALQVMWNRLLSIVEEQAQTLIRAAFSPIVRESGDLSAGVFDAQGRMLAQAVTGTPGHINTMAEAVRTLRDTITLQDMTPGDIWVTNDPWLASGHLNDFLLIMPVFLDDRVVGFTSCTSHLADLGGQGMGPEGSDVFDEGLRIPPCKLVEKGEINSLLLSIVKANSREPVANEGDIYALIASCEAGTERVVAIMREFMLRDLDGLAAHIIDTSRRGTEAAIAEIPSGKYQNTMMVDGYDQPIRLQATLTVGEGQILLDFDGTSPCSGKGINVPLNYAAAYSVFAMRNIIGPDIPNNAGSLAPFRVTGPPGCILNAQDPAPVAMRHTLGQMTPDLVYGCLAQAVPDRVPAEGASAMYDLPMRHVPGADAAGDPLFAVEFVHNGGTGARPSQDGLSATAFPSGVWGTQIEIAEASAPILFHRRELRLDSGGAGQFRGGLGQRIEFEPVNETGVLLFLSVERMRFPAAGRHGGSAGASGRIRVDAGPDLASKGEIRIAPGQRLIFETPGGGGFGPPRDRDRASIRHDLTEELIGSECAQTVYGVENEHDPSG